MKPSRILFLVFVLAIIFVSPALANVNESNWTNSTATIYRFTHSNSSYYCTNWTPPAANLSVQYLIVGGGASGGNGYGAGGAGGGLLEGTIADLPGSPVTLCVAGAVPINAYPNNGNNGLNSTFGSLTALGGGYGAKGDVATAGGNGGCGGGGARTGGSGSGTSGQGFDGGSSVETYSAGGGGSPAHQGYNSTGTDYSNAVGGNGADGKWSDIAGIWLRFGPGGGGYGYMTGGTGGAGGGGRGGQSNSPPYSATNGTYDNGAGGGGDNNAGGTGYTLAGGSGVIYLRYTAATYNPPPSIANLANSSTTCNSTVISWTNPGDLSNFNHTAFWRNSVAHYNASNTTTTFTDTGLSEHTWYNYSSRTTNMAGAMNTSFVNVSVFTQSCMAPVVAAFSCAPTSGNAPLGVTCTDASTGSPTSWYWEFGDGNTSIVQNPTNTYGWAGLFSVNLNASKPGSSDWENKTNHINVSWATPVTPTPTVTPTESYTVIPGNCQYVTTDRISDSAITWNYTQLVTNPNLTIMSIATDGTIITVPDKSGLFIQAGLKSGEWHSLTVRTNQSVCGSKYQTDNTGALKLWEISNDYIWAIFAIGLILAAILLRIPVFNVLSLFPALIGLVTSIEPTVTMSFASIRFWVYIILLISGLIIFLIQMIKGR